MRVVEILSLGRPLRVLVIEDDFFTRDILCELLAEIDVEVACVSSLTEIAADDSPDLVISDLVGPSAHRAEPGSAYLASLRGRFPAARILVLSAQSWILADSGRLPVDELMAKPFDLADLLRRVRALLDPAQTLGRAS